MATGSTPLYGIPYPLSTDLVNVHSDLYDLATSVENIFGIFNVSLTSLNTWTNRNIFQTSTSDPTVKITQAGSGHALVIEDTASDPSPFIVDNSGNVIIGKSTSATAKLDVVGDIALTGSIIFPGGISVTSPSSSGAIPVNPMTTKGDIIIGGVNGVETRLAGASSGNQILVYDTNTNSPKWTNVVNHLTIDYPNILLDNQHTFDTGHITWDDPTRLLKIGDGARILTFYPFEVNETEHVADRLFVTNDANKLHQMNGAFKFIVPEELGANYPIGTQIHMVALTDGVSVEFSSGITAFYTPGLKLRTVGSMATLIKLGTNKWVLSGDLTA